MYGPERVGFTRPKVVRPVEKDRSAQILFLVGLLLPIPFIYASFWIAGWRGMLPLLGLLAGFVTALTLVFLADIVQRLFNAFHGDRTDSAKRLLFPFDNPVASWAERSHLLRLFEGRWAAALVNRLTRLDPRFGQGYLKRKEGNVHIYPGHSLAIIVLLAYLAIYVCGIYFWNNPILDKFGLPTDLGISTLTFVFVLATLLLFALSSVAFYFDRYRVPPLLILILVVCFSDPDHRYEALPIADDRRPTPEEIFQDRAGDPFIILVSAIGGGIQTSAWATEVLTGLDEACQREAVADNGSCADRIALISGVSGGSVGAMYFMERYRNNEVDPKDLIARIKQYAYRSSLEFVGSSIVFDDLPRQIPTVSRGLEMDRGQQLARGWIYNQQRIDADSGRPKPVMVAGDAMLSDWHLKPQGDEDMEPEDRDRKRPAFIFGTTVVETGERILISTAKLNADTLKPYAARSLDDFVGVPTDLKIVDAVRLSAAFAFVSPAARMKRSEKFGTNQSSDAFNYHLVDGGYHDNPGLLAVRDFVAEGISGLGGKRPKIAVIQIVGEEPDESPTLERKQLLELNWFKQLAAPLNVFWNVTWIVQSTRTAAAEKEIAQLVKENSGYGEQEIKFFKFHFESEKGAPLSWHLTESEQEAIRMSATLAFAENGTEWSRLRAFLKGSR
ncbi:MAG TPA: patatin-like phospholipase family protein [Pyrinomonadaceae bacterium]|nr:patatin-like phospholipase family protein [Pyrinomonadaceae bacterium]HMP65590.1 patatin-like phospholipase family protein [Pyrinomonadaceae bacterium]